MRLLVLGLNHRTAPLEMRERVAFLPQEAAAALDRFRAAGTVSEVVIVSTCNRTELYSVAEDTDAAIAAKLAVIREVKNLDLSDGRYTYIHEQQEAVEHLFRVAGGIDSMVIGETGILGQVKEAFELASRRETVGTVLGRLFPLAFRVGKRARSETRIGEGAGSVAKGGIQLARRVFGDLKEHTALVIGAGETGSHVATLLRGAGVRSLLVANRTFETAEDVAAREGGRAVALADIDDELRGAHVVFCAVSTPQPILTSARVEKAIGGRRKSPLLVIDLGVPRNVSPDVGDLENVFLYAVDDLQELVNLNVGRREGEIPAVERIVAEEAEGFREWRGTLAAKPVIVGIRNEFENIRREALEKFAKSLSDPERELLERFSRGFMNKMLHGPTVSVRECDPETTVGRARLEWTRAMFGLDDPAMQNGNLDDPPEEKE